ncbi:MAG: sensor histidine kinase [Betaproteobacteria bacterium]|nr:MAG: sensor histidine kinase [Betaproteobacteria bacterium]
MATAAPDSRHSAQSLPWRAYQHHPLDLFPLCRRWKPSALRSYVYTTLICVAVVVAIMLVNAMFGFRPSAGQLKQYTLIAVSIGFCQQLMFDLFGFAAARLQVARSGALMAAMAILPPVLGLYGGFFISAVLLGGGPWYGWLFGRTNLILNSIIVVAVALFIWYSTANREKLHAAELAEAESAARAEAAKREATAAELKALRAQVEPHFLYNTLANVVSLIDRDAPQAKRMTERLIGYLRQTLDASRRDNATLGDELAIISDYLEILRLRMGARLQYAIDVSPEVRALTLAPMLLQPLVENAIKHGLEPKIEGGTVRIGAAISGDALRIHVDDDGLGFGVATDTAGSGTGLANVRARLQALYGQAARVTIDSLGAATPSSALDNASSPGWGVEKTSPTGTRITLSLPIDKLNTTYLLNAT